MLRPENLMGETVLYGCLNWGSGHIARSLPLMQQLLDQGNKLVLWCTEDQRKIAVSYGLQATFVEDELFFFRFRGDGNFTREIIRNARGFRNAVAQQRRQTQKLVKHHAISAIVSDHCYGLIHPEIPSFFVTHQVRLPRKSGWIAQWIHRKWMERFHTIWIMDDPEIRLAGALSVSHPKACYIGFYSRFTHTTSQQDGGGLVAVVSGPEPYAEQLCRTIVKESEATHVPVTIIAPRTYGLEVGGGICFITGNWKSADEAILRADLIISRSGYTTLMDLIALQKKALLIPTPGQTEQVYLATKNQSTDWKLVTSMDGFLQNHA